MTRSTPESTTRALGRRAAQLALVGALAATPLAFTGGIASADTDWDALAQCESSGKWNTNTGNGFSGGLQFTPSTWKAFGGKGNAKDASRSEQIEVAEKVKAEQGMNAWPTCSKKTGQTSSSANSTSSSKSSSSDSDSDSDSSGSGSGSGGSSSSGRSSGSKASVPAQAPAGGYTVRSGDTVGEIAAAHGTSVQTIADRNALPDADAIAPGQTLAVS